MLEGIRSNSTGNNGQPTHMDIPAVQICTEAKVFTSYYTIKQIQEEKWFMSIKPQSVLGFTSILIGQIISILIFLTSSNPCIVGQIKI